MTLLSSFSPNHPTRSNLLHRVVVPSFLGLLLVLALPPFEYVWLTPFVLSGLLYLVHHQTKASGAFFVGLSGGFAFFLGGTYWINNALLLDAHFYWLTVPATVFIPLCLALYWALPSLLTWWCRRRLSLTHPLGILLVWASTFTLFEVIRSYIWLAFPWNPFSLCVMGTLPLVQTAYWITSFGVSFLVVLFGSAFFTIGDSITHLGARHTSDHTKKWTEGPTAPKSVYLSWLQPWLDLLPGLISIILIIALYTYGAYRLDHHPTVFGPTRVIMVQPNTQQKVFTNGKEKTSNLLSILRLTLHHLNNRPNEESDTILQNPSSSANLATPPHLPYLIVWPESAIPYNISLNPSLLAWLKQNLPHDSVLITGATRSVHANHGSPLYVIFNSMLVITPDYGIVDIYDKHHLVPFGEFIPLSWAIRHILPLSSITGEGVDFSQGPGAISLPLPKGLPTISPSICYEAIFPQHRPGMNTDDLSAPPQVIVNITNDAWFGHHTGPYQHLAMARLRSIEQGLPTIRVATTGISALVDPMGRIIESLPLGTQGIIDAHLPEPL